MVKSDLFGINLFGVNFSHTIPLKSGVRVYNMSWTPGNSFAVSEMLLISVVACDLDVFLVDKYVGGRDLVCRVTCPDKETAEQVYRQDPHRRGLCSTEFSAIKYIHTVELQFVRHNTSKIQTNSNLSILWDRIDIRIMSAVMWSIIDQTRCSSSSWEDSKYACVSNHSGCTSGSPDGYVCRCNKGYQGNPYIRDGCSPDMGYNPKPQKANCSRWCGDIYVAFPFGLEEGCAARQVFQLNCSNAAVNILQYNDALRVTYIDVGEGLMGAKYTSSAGEQIFNAMMQTQPLQGQEPNLYVDPLESVSVKWAVANLTCQDAKQNTSGYACVSINSSCISVVSSTEGYVGYRCACLSGFQGNPYNPDGCQDIDECARTPGVCRGTCHNTIGNYSCTECPDNEEYDITKMQCTEKRKQNPFSGIIFGLGSGFGMLLLGVSAMVVIRRWKKDVQKKLRRKYFRKNQGLLLEQLISSDENAS